MTEQPRYDGLSECYDANIGEFAGVAGRELLGLVGSGPGPCLDLGCGTGINLGPLADAGWSVVGVDISADQLRLARERVRDEIELVQADTTRLPFDDGAFDAVACSLLHTDVDDLGVVWRETARVLRPGGRLAYVGTHPCFVGPFASQSTRRRRSCSRTQRRSVSRSGPSFLRADLRPKGVR